MTLIERLIAIARAEVGIREVGGNNCGPRIREYQAATWLKPAAWPWCAAWTCWLLREWLKDPEVLQTIRDTVAPEFDAEKWRCKDASAFGWEKWARDKGLQVLTAKDQAKAGDFVIYDFNGPADGGGHIGLVVEDQIGPYIKTIEGNTNGRGDRDSELGDGVWEKTRNTKMVRAFIRIL